MEQKTKNIKAVMEDHALEPVPESERKNWLALTWNTAGICTTLIIIFFGALLTYVAGIKIALICGVLVTLVGGTLGSITGHLAYKTGFSSTVMARFLGFGKKGSIIASLIFAFMIIGFLALENALLYKGFIFAFNLPDTILNAIIIYGLLTITWILLTAYGFKLVAQVSSVTLIAFLFVLVYVTWVIVNKYGGDGSIWAIAPRFPEKDLLAMGAHTVAGKYIFGINLLIGSAGALALVDADMGRYARSTKDITIAAFIANAAMSIAMVFVGGVMMDAGGTELVNHYIGRGMDPQAAGQLALSPDGVTAVFILIGGFLGTILMVLAQGKAQVLNTYSASLSLTNLFDALTSWKPGRVTFVILANIIGLFMLYGQILALVNDWINILGVLTTTFAGIMIADYYIVRKRQLNIEEEIQKNEIVNWAGVITVVLATVLAHYVLPSVIPIEFLTSLGVSLIGYPVLRLLVFKR